MQAALLLLAGAGSLHAQSPLVPPPNDYLTNAAGVTGSQFVLTADLALATAEPFEPSRQECGGHTAWWRWTAPENGIFVWEVPTNSNPATLAIFRSDSFQQLTPVAATYWLPSTKPFEVGQPVPWGTFQAAAGSEYFFQVDVALSGLVVFAHPLVLTNPYPISISILFTQPAAPAPTNDAYAARVTLVGTNASFGGSLFAASAEPNEPRLPGDAMQRTLWWQWTAPGAGTASISSPSAVVGVFRRGLWNQLELHAHSGTEYGNECFRFWGTRPEVRWDTEAGITYDLMVDRYPEMDARQDATLNLRWLPAPPNDSFTSPQWLNGDDLSLVVSNTSATSLGEDRVFNGSTNSKSVWFAWQSPTNGILQVTTNQPARFADPGFVALPPNYYFAAGEFQFGPWPCSSIEDLHPLVPFIPIWALYEEAGGEFSYRGSAQITLWRDVYAGLDYRIGLDGLEGGAGVTTLNLLFTSPPSNDAFANRIRLPQNAVRVTGRTFAASADAGYHPQQVQYGARSVWWEWHAPAAGAWALRIISGMGDNHFAIYRGTNATPAGEVACSLGEPMVFEAVADEAFQIGVFAVPGWGGNVEFSMFEARSPALTLREVVHPWNGDRHWGLFASDTSTLWYRIETSSNLHDWSPIQTNQAWFPQEVLPLNTSLPCQFFRTRLLP